MALTDTAATPRDSVTLSTTSVPVLNDDTYARWKEYILPTPEELEWHAIPWRPSFWSAVIDAQRAEKPVLLWAMNGHPLACT